MVKPSLIWNVVSLDTNGVRVVVDAKVVDKDVKLPEERQTSAETLEADTLEVLADLNHTSQKGLQTIFDSSVGRSTVNHPLGGRYQITPTEASVQKLPVQHGVTQLLLLWRKDSNPYGRMVSISWCGLCGHRSNRSFGLLLVQTGLGSFLLSRILRAYG